MTESDPLPAVAYDLLRYLEDMSPERPRLLDLPVDRDAGGEFEDELLWVVLVERGFVELGSWNGREWLKFRGFDLLRRLRRPDLDEELRMKLTTNGRKALHQHDLMRKRAPRSPLVERGTLEWHVLKILYKARAFGFDSRVPGPELSRRACSFDGTERAPGDLTKNLKDKELVTSGREAGGYYLTLKGREEGARHLGKA